MNTPPKIADYTTRKSYQQDYAAKNREAINARKREWRSARKFLKALEQEQQRAKIRQIQDGFRQHQ